jgi:hypothetical protein
MYICIKYIKDNNRVCIRDGFRKLSITQPQYDKDMAYNEQQITCKNLQKLSNTMDKY